MFIRLICVHLWFALKSQYNQPKITPQHTKETVESTMIKINQLPFFISPATTPKDRPKTETIIRSNHQPPARVYTSRLNHPSRPFRVLSCFVTFAFFRVFRVPCSYFRQVSNLRTRQGNTPHRHVRQPAVPDSARCRNKCSNQTSPSK